MLKTIGNALRGSWAFIVDLCVDGYGAVTATAAPLSIAFTLAKFYEVDLAGIRELSYAWALLPIAIWFFVAYVRRRAMTNRRRKVKKLKELYAEVGPLITQKVTSQVEFETYDNEGFEWKEGTSTWIAENFGPLAKARFLDLTGMEAAHIVGAFNHHHVDIILALTRYRQNLVRLIESDVWDEG